MTLPLAWTSGSFIDALQLIARTNRSTIFWTVLAILLGIGCIVYLFRWLYERIVQAQNRQLGTVYELAESLISADDFESVQQRVTEIIADLAGATHCFLLILNPAKQQLEYVAGNQKPPLSVVSLSAMSGAVTCYRNQALTGVPDAENCPFVDKEAVRRLRQKSLLYVPLFADGQCFGILEVEDRRRKRMFSSEQVARVEHVGKLTALAWTLHSESSLREQLVRTEKATLVRDLIEGVAEQISRHLARIRSLTRKDLVAADSPYSAEMAELDRETRQASEVLNLILGFVRPKESEPSGADANAVLEEVIACLQARFDEHRLTADLQLSRRALPIPVGRDLLASLLTNLLRNALRMLAGARGSSLQISSSLMSNCALISVTPTGIVQAAPNVPRTGSEEPERESEPDVLRLSVCRGLVEGLGGALRVDHGTPRGFQLEVELPLAAGEWTQRVSSPARAGAPDSPSQPMTALIIEDNVEMQKALVQHIAERGYRALAVGTAEEGLNLCEQMRFDWVLCSARIGRTSGLEIYQRVRHRVGNFVLLTEADSPLASSEGPETPRILRIPFTPRDVDELLEAEMARVESSG